MTSKKQHVTDHLANERTYLAWIRTNLGIMAFGFVVERFSFFVEQVALVLDKTGTKPTTSLENYTSLFGISLVAVGAILCIFSFLKFKRAKKQIDEDSYQSSLLLDTLLMIFVFLIGCFLLVYLIKSNRALI